MKENIVIRKLALPNEDWMKVLKGAGLAALGAVVTYAASHIGDMNFGEYTYIIVPAVTVVLNVVRKVILNEPANIIGLSEGEAKPIEKKD